MMVRRILLIDDDRAQHRITAAQLKLFPRESFEFDGALTYEDGLNKLLSGGYAACLLDYQLGERDGLQLIREAVAAGCRTPIVFLTAETSTHIDVQAMNAGALDYLVKGEITPRMLERSVRYAVKLAETLGALRELAQRDELTGLLNRREFDRILADEQARALRFDHPLGLLMVDVDHFKTVNDSRGHPVGDAVLREVARRLGREVRNVDRVARFGGDEFAVILVQADEPAARDVAERIWTAMGATPVTVSDRLALPVSVSIGAAVLPTHARAAGELLRAADEALYAAKAAGRNRVAMAARSTA